MALGHELISDHLCSTIFVWIVLYKCLWIFAYIRLQRQAKTRSFAAAKSRIRVGAMDTGYNFEISFEFSILSFFAMRQSDLCNYSPCSC